MNITTQSKNLKLIREIFDYTPDHIATILDLKARSYRLYESGDLKISEAQIKKLSAFYKINVLEIIDLSKEDLLKKITYKEPDVTKIFANQILEICRYYNNYMFNPHYALEYSKG